MKHIIKTHLNPLYHEQMSFPLKLFAESARRQDRDLFWEGIESLKGRDEASFDGFLYWLFFKRTQENDPSHWHNDNILYELFLVFLAHLESP